MTIKGWVVVIGRAPKHRPYVACGPDATFSDTRVDGGYLFATRKQAREYLQAVCSDDEQDCAVHRATATLTVEPR
jgi:hypothetical protein